MATLSIRNLPDAVHARLRLRAARSGRSMEAEARKLLATAVFEESAASGIEDIQAVVSRLYGDRPSRSTADDLIAERRAEADHE